MKKDRVERTGFCFSTNPFTTGQGEANKITLNFVV